MAVMRYKDSFHKELAKEGQAVKSSTREALATFDFKNGLHNFMLKNTVCYDDDSVLTEPGAAAKGKYPKAALDVWTQIANTMAVRFAKDRNGISCPKGKSGAVFAGARHPITQIDQTPVVIASASFPKNAEKAILNWFKRNYDYAVTDYNEKISQPNFNTNTAPDNKTESEKVRDLFNDYYKGKQFGAKGATLPALVLDKLKNRPYPEYMPFCKPHKDATVTVTGNGGSRKGPEGFCIGPFNRNVPLIETNEIAEINDNGNKEEVPVFRTEVNPTDQNEFLIDNEFYQPAIRSALGASGYGTFRRNVAKALGANPTEELPLSDLPIDAKEILIPPEEPGLPATRLSPRLFNLDKRGIGITKQPLVNGGIKNPEWKQPLKDPAFGAPEFDPDLDVKEWKNNADKPFCFFPGKDKGSVWSGGQRRTGVRYGPNTEEPVLNFMKFLTVDIQEIDGIDLPFNDPRTWAPWDEYTGNGKRATDPEDHAIREAGLDKLKYKYIIPKGLIDAVKKPMSDVPHRKANGLPGFGGETLPLMNKSYWGLRVLEAFPKARTLEEAIGEALKPPKREGAGNPVVVPGAGGVMKPNQFVKFIGGPAPPFIVREKGSKDRTWKFDNSVCLFKKGSLTRSTGSPFARNTAPTAGQYRDFSNNIVGIDKKIDKKIQGEARGGMTWQDVSKQIIPPYAPPPLKPPLPNTKPFKF
jgi:hypothetical protein